MMKALKKIIFAVVLLGIGITAGKINVYAYNVFPAEDTYYYKTVYGAYVYDKPEIGANELTYIAAYTDLYVTGVTDTGFFQILLNEKTCYISGLFVQLKSKYPTGKQATKEAFNKIAEAYIMQLDMCKGYINKFAIKDITNDGFPELIFDNGKEIYTYYEEKPVLIYYSETPKTYFYNKANKLTISATYYEGKGLFEVLTMDYSWLPWGQLTCFYPGLAGQKITDYKAITYNYVNDEKTKSELGATLYSLYVAGSL